MTRKQTIETFAYIVAAYPNHDKFKDAEQVEAMINVWASMFQDDDAATVAAAVKKHISISKWPPSIAEIRDIMVDLMHPDLIPPDLAWEAVSDLFYAAGEQDRHNLVDKILPPLIHRVVTTIGWHKLYNLHCGSYRGNKDGMDRVAFMELYRPAYERERQAACCPRGLAEGINAMRMQASDGGIMQLEAAKEARRKREEEYDFIFSRRSALPDAQERRALASGKEDTEE